MEPSYSSFENNHLLNNQPYSEVNLTAFQDDGIWLISCSFSIWTMVSGFGLLESGRVSSKDEVNIMVKNVVDVVFGGLSYWMFGFGFTYGKDFPNPYIGIGNFFYNPDDKGQPSDQAWHYARFFFQMSFATTTSTIVSAAMAERIRLKPYIVITYLMTLVHSITAHWVWSEDGFLRQLGVVDAAGCSVVHLVGGISGLAATLYLRPRQARFGERGSAHMSNSIGGGCTSIIISLVSTRKCQIDLLIDGLLASLVSTTAGCHSLRPVDSIAVGAIGAALALSVYPLVEKLEIDDPVGVIPVHVIGSAWGMICVGIFSYEDHETVKEDPRNRGVTGSKYGLLHSGDFELIKVQALCVVCVSAFSLIVTFLSLIIMNQFPWGLRMTKYEEQLGADLIEHGLAGHNIANYSIEKKLNVKSNEVEALRNAYSIIKYVAKWKRKARLAREKRAAEAAALNIETNNRLSIGGEISSGIQNPNTSNNNNIPSTKIRLGPLKLSGLRRPSSNLFGGTSSLSARPKSTLGRRIIEKEENSLPPLRSPRPPQQKDTNSDFDKTSLDGRLPNGIPGNGSIPLKRPKSIVITPSSPTPSIQQNRILPPLRMPNVEEEITENNNNENERNGLRRNSENSNEITRSGGSRSLIGRFRRGARVAPGNEDIALQDSPPPYSQQSTNNRIRQREYQNPPFSSRSTSAVVHSESIDERQLKKTDSMQTLEIEKGNLTTRKRENITTNDSIV
ncbi:Ammonium transporter [Meloidogyne graminicola]|uniref:Ammonium transporter n=1 Tax=Meloidogyne graminicola TaxID=189291 RepID=A0A8T0A2A7_9BILA|nr:Ammonium transporter [Meloidogyne graminicola]